MTRPHEHTGADTAPKIRSTTILAVRKDGKVAVAGDGQVTMGEEMVKGSAKKVRRLYHGKILAGFAGATADAFTLFERFEESWSSTTATLPDRRWS